MRNAAAHRARQAVGYARATPEVRDHDDPAARAEIVCDGLGVAAVAAAFQPVEQDQRGRVGRLRQRFPVRIRHPPRRGGLAIGDRALPADGRAVGSLVREQARAGPVEVHEIGVRRFHPVAHERDPVVLREYRGVYRLGIASGQPGGNGAGGRI
ncbi:hypothetical protein G6F32_015285 [Rhizopus arrhizus]|nr:hypothetical protein G6F32_015285 [Rhizopus arrhizus]